MGTNHLKLLTVLVLAASACASAPRVAATPAQRVTAMQILLEGGSSTDVAARFSLPRDQARELIHSTLLDLARLYYRHR